MSAGIPLSPAGVAPGTEAPPSWWCRTPILAAIFFAAILLNNAEFVFRSQQYELGDHAANSLQILQAKEFRELLGQYSRFGFHHPGPAFFYAYALGEALFYDGVRLVRTPFNAQFIALHALSAFFFGATLSLIARRIGRACGKWFLGFSLLLAAWHFGAVGEFYELTVNQAGFFNIWPPCVLVLPFLCYLVAAASVASGSGRDLPLMTLAGCFLLHGYVSMPLFVFPLSLLAYGALIQDSRTTGLASAWPWRVFPRQHWFAGAIIAIFLVPIVVDLVTANPNNIQAIFDEIRSRSGERQGPVRSLLYFLHFGAYRPYPNSHAISAFEAFDFTGTVLFFRAHWRVYVLWLTAVLLPLAILMRLGGGVPNRVASAGQGASDPLPEVKKLLVWMYTVFGSAVVLSLVWGHVLKGTMFYYVSLFNFAIYYGFLLIFAIASALWIEQQLLPRFPPPVGVGHWRNRLAALGPMLFVCAAVAAFVHEAHRFRTVPPDQNEQRLFATAIERALEIDPAEPKFLNFEGAGWSEALGIALYLERRGLIWMVREDWPIIFGRDRVITKKRPGPPFPTPSSSFWRIVLPETSASLVAKDQRLKVLRLTSRFDLVIGPDPGPEAQIEK